jgi:hypothetical protein
MFFVLYFLVALSNLNCMNYTLEVDSLLALKNDLAIYLKQVIEDDYFKDYFSDSPFFSFLYLKNSQYIIDFLEQLPLMDILIQCNFKDVEFKKVILNQLFNDLQEKRNTYKQLVFLLPPIITFIKTLNLTLEYEQIQNAITAFHTPLIDATEPIQIITANSYKHLEYLEMQKDLLQERLNLGVTIDFLFEDTLQIIITYTYQKVPLVVIVCDCGLTSYNYKVLYLTSVKPFI